MTPRIIKKTLKIWQNAKINIHISGGTFLSIPLFLISGDILINYPMMRLDEAATADLVITD